MGRIINIFTDRSKAVVLLRFSDACFAISFGDVSPYVIIMYTRPTFSTAEGQFYLDIYTLVYINLKGTFVIII